jgi:hypothetical protein
LSFDSPVRFPVKILLNFLSENIEKIPFKKASESHQLQLADKKGACNERKCSCCRLLRTITKKCAETNNFDKEIFSLLEFSWSLYAVYDGKKARKEGVSIQRSAPL